MRPSAVLVILAALVGFGMYQRPWQGTRYEPGVLVPLQPVQTAMPPERLGSMKGYGIEALAKYEITARVLRTKRYWSGQGSDLVPVDVAIGWGPMSDQAILDQLKITQGNRFFFY